MTNWKRSAAWDLVELLRKFRSVDLPRMTRVGDSLRTFRSIDKSDRQSDPFPIQRRRGKLARGNRKYRESRHFAEGKARADRRPVVQTVSAKDADYENIFRENFNPRRSIHAIGGSRDPRQFPRCRSITWPHTRQRISGNLTFRESHLSHSTWSYRAKL